MMRKSAQAAVEFLITYGWMLMVVLMVGGALAYLGVFDSERLLPQECLLSLDFGCEQYTARTDGLVRVSLSNKLGEPIDVTSFVCTYESGLSSQDTTYVVVNNWRPGDTQTFECDPVGVGTYAKGDRAEVTLTMQYQKTSGAGFSKSVEGRLRANVN